MFPCKTEKMQAPLHSCCSVAAALETANLMLGHVEAEGNILTAQPPTDLLVYCAENKRQSKVKSTHTIGKTLLDARLQSRKLLVSREKHFCTRKPGSEMGFLATERALANKKRGIFSSPKLINLL